MAPEGWRALDVDGGETVVRATVAYAAVAIVGIGLGGVASVLAGGLAFGHLRVLMGFLVPLAAVALVVGLVGGTVLAFRTADARPSWSR